MLSMILGEIVLRELIAALPIDFDAVFAYGVIAILIGLIWWNKHTEPDPAPPYGPAEAEQKGQERR